MFKVVNITAQKLLVCNFGGGAHILHYIDCSESEDSNRIRLLVDIPEEQPWNIARFPMPIIGSTDRALDLNCYNSVIFATGIEGKHNLIGLNFSFSGQPFAIPFLH